MTEQKWILLKILALFYRNMGLAFLSIQFDLFEGGHSLSDLWKREKRKDDSFLSIWSFVSAPFLWQLPYSLNIFKQKGMEDMVNDPKVTPQYSREYIKSKAIKYKWFF